MKRLVTFILCALAALTVSCSTDTGNSVETYIRQQVLYAELVGNATSASITASLACKDDLTLIDGIITAAYDDSVIKGAQFYYALTVDGTVIDEGIVDLQGPSSPITKPTAVEDFDGKSAQYIIGTPTREGSMTTRSQSVEIKKC